MARKPKRVKPEVSDYAQDIIKRIEECEIVVGELDASRVWQIVQKDLEEQRKQLDDFWQNITDTDKLQKARELKMATLHILNLKDKYKEELDARKKELGEYESPDKVIKKDYDTEGIENGR